MSIKESFDQISTTLQPYPSAKLIAVSKKQPIDKIEVLYHLGHHDFGENYVQELIEKDEELQKKGIHQIQWHFIGHLQKNKINSLLKHPFKHPLIIHSIDSVDLARALSDKLEVHQKQNSAIQVFLQVNIDQETTKSGFTAIELVHNYEFIQALPNIKVIGLMCIPMSYPDSIESFKEMRKLRDQLDPALKLSMGMSEDYLDALEHGSNYIRIGTSLFGARL